MPATLDYGTARGRDARDTRGQDARDTRKRVRSLLRDDRGSAMLEWTLVLAAFALPMFFVFKVLLGVLTAHFGMVSFLETIPFP